MQDHPPHSLPEIQAMVSRYLDGTLEADARRQLEKLLDEHSAYREELKRQQSLQGALRQSSEQQLHYTKVSDGIWQNLARQLEADQAAELMEADPEFICAYYDNEIPSHDPVLKAFESQLYRNTEANRLLADMGQVSEAVRQFGYRLEEACTLDISQAVMAAYTAELGMEEDAPGDPRQELLSAYVDKELSGKQLIEATRLIENDPAARQTVQLYTRLSERIQAVSEQLQRQAPDVWPAVKLRLEQEPAADAAGSGKVVPFKKALRYAVPASVAAILLIFAVPALHSGTNLQLSSPMMKNEGRMIADAGALPAAEIASVDNEADPRLREASFTDSPLSGPMLEPSMEAQPEDQLLKQAGGAGGAAADGASSDIPELKPMLDPEMNAPQAPAPAAMPQKEARAKKNTAGPSSEEYLFDALSQQMTSEEILALLGE